MKKRHTIPHSQWKQILNFQVWWGQTVNTNLSQYYKICCYHTISDDGYALNLIRRHLHSKVQPAGKGQRFLPYIPAWNYTMLPLKTNCKWTEMSIPTNLMEFWAWIMKSIFVTSFMDSLYTEVSSSML
jgi:hypothetical protein